MENNIGGWVYVCMWHGFWASDETDHPDLCPRCNEICGIVGRVLTKRKMNTPVFSYESLTALMLGEQTSYSPVSTAAIFVDQDEANDGR